MTTIIGRTACVVSIFAAIRRTFIGPGNARKCLAGVVLAATVFAPLTFVQAAPSGTGFLRLDTTFDVDGRRTDSFGLSSDSIGAAALLPGGKIVAAVSVRTGVSTAGSKFEGVLVRFNPDGTRDLTFAPNCRASAILGQSSAGIGGLAVQPDGKVLYIWSSTNFINPGGSGTTTSSGVSRCNADGTIDSSFTPGGLSLGSQGGLSSVAVRPDGKIVIAGRAQASITSISQLGIFRLNPNGSLDSTFAGGGQAFTSNLNSAGPIALQSDGKVYVAGSGSSVNLVRVNDSGAADPSFDGDGYRQTPFEAASLAVQADGKLLVTGTMSNDFAVARYNTDGSPDATFDNDGIVTTPVGPGNDTARSVAVQADGKIVVAGRAHNGTNDDFGMVRYNADGSLDTSFDGDGKLTTALHAGADSASSVLVRGDGKLVVAGTTHTGISNDIAIVQYLPDGSLDSAFGSGGKSVIDLENQSSVASAVAVQGDGKVVVAGSAGNGDLNSDFAVIRYNVDGSPDTSFDGDGKAITPVLSWNDAAASIAIQPDGKIVAAGRAEQSENSSNYDFAVVRYNVDGSLDTTFDGDGKVTTPVSTSDDQGYSVAIQADGKIVVGGAARGASNQDFAVVRYNADGSLDTAFDGDGKAVTPVSTASDIAWSVKIQADGKIVAGGAANTGFGIVRYNADGSLDTSFDGDGKATTAVGSGSARARSIAIQSDGKIVAAGDAAGMFAFARYNPDGSPDPAFDGDGQMTTTVTGTANYVGSIAIQADGKIVAGGGARIGSNSVNALARLNPNGTLDATFDVDGRASLNLLGPLNSIALDGQNRIVATANLTEQFNEVNSFLVVRAFAKESRLFDHEGNGAADIAVWRPSNNNWYTQNSAGFAVSEWGQAGDKLAPADYDGDGNSDLAVFRPSDGSWRILQSSTQTLVTFNFGQDGDLPVPADRNADGIAEPILYRPSTSTWHTRFGPGIITIVQFGVPGDKPLLGDFDGDGRADNAVFRPSNSTWYIQGTSSGFSVVTWGAIDDKPVPADYDGDGRTDVAIYRPSTGQWFVIGSTAGWMIRNWGEPADIPVPADYDGDGRADLAIFRPSSGTWYIIFSETGNFYVRAFGQDGDTPIPSAFVY